MQRNKYVCTHNTNLVLLWVISSRAIIAPQECDPLGQERSHDDDLYSLLKPAHDGRRRPEENPHSSPEKETNKLGERKSTKWSTL